MGLFGHFDISLARAVVAFLDVFVVVGVVVVGCSSDGNLLATAVPSSIDDLVIAAGPIS